MKLHLERLDDDHFRVGPATFDNPVDARDYLLRQFGITPKEYEVLKELATGLFYKQIAAKRGLSIKTIEKQMNDLRKKTGTHDKVHEPTQPQTERPARRRGPREGRHRRASRKGRLRHGGARAEALCNGVTFSKTVWAQAHNLRLKAGVKTSVACAFRSGLVEV